MKTDEPSLPASGCNADNAVIDNRSTYMALVGPILRLGDRDVFAFRAEAKHNNLGGVTHGGMLMTLLDSGMGRVAAKACGNQTVVTIQLSTHFLSSVSAGELVQTEASVVRAGGSLVFMEGKLRVGPRIVATANGIWKIRPTKRSTE